MDLTPYVDAVRRELAVAAEAGGDEARALAERLSAPLASAIRLTLLDALSAAADEITRDLAPGSVEVRLRAGEASFAIAVPEPAAAAPATEVAPTVTPTMVPSEPDDAVDEGTMVRINLRLSEQLKARIEDAAAEKGRSVNAWIVRAATAALRGEPAATPPPGGSRSTQHFTGWVN